jgi:excisionase family DNA binding protein
MSSNIKVQRICQHCDNEFTARTTTTLYCSHRCNSAAYKAKKRAAKVEASNKETNNVKSRPIEELKAKAFLSIDETCKLVGISRRTVYRMIERGELVTGKAGKRTIIRRSDLEQILFSQSQPLIHKPENKPTPLHYEIADCYNLTEIQTKYGISEKALQDIIKRNSISKIKKGKYAYVPKTIIDKLLN